MIVVFGSINVDLIVPVPRLPRAGETVLGGDYAILPGGKGANQALAARRAGAEVAMAGAVGADPFADLALDLLRKHHTGRADGGAPERNCNVDPTPADTWRIQPAQPGARPADRHRSIARNRSCGRKRR